jgi:DNA-binding beta-propeller fold protein YncE
MVEVCDPAWPLCAYIAHNFQNDCIRCMKKTLLFLIFTVLFSAAAVAQTAKSAPLKVYPNPATEYIQVADPNETTGYVSIFNIMGRNLREFEFVKDERYYIGDLSKGIYLVYLQDKSKKTIATYKIEKR